MSGWGVALVAKWPFGRDPSGVTLGNFPSEAAPRGRAQWSDREIAQACGVSREYVCRLANSMSASCDRSQDGVREVSRAGKKYPQNTAKIGRANKPRKSAGIVGSEMNPIRQPRPALVRTNLPHDPAHGARAIVSALGIDYARQLIQTLTSYLHPQKEGDA